MSSLGCSSFFPGGGSRFAAAVIALVSVWVLAFAGDPPHGAGAPETPAAATGGSGIAFF